MSFIITLAAKRRWKGMVIMFIKVIFLYCIVECPVCGIHILERTINNHLDICLKYSTSRQRNTKYINSYVDLSL